MSRDAAGEGVYEEGRRCSGVPDTLPCCLPCRRVVAVMRAVTSSRRDSSFLLLWLGICVSIESWVNFHFLFL